MWSWATCGLTFTLSAARRWRLIKLGGRARIRGRRVIRFCPAAAILPLETVPLPPLMKPQRSGDKKCCCYRAKKYENADVVELDKPDGVIGLKATTGYH